MTIHAYRFFLRADRIAAVIFQHHLSQDGFASEIGVSRQHWSLLFNRRRPLSAKVCRALLANPRLAGIPESELFEVLPTEPAAA